MRFEGSNALVTGGSSGIGYATAAALIAEGADRVYVTGRNAQALRAAADRLGEKAIPVVADASSLSDSAALADRVRADGVTLDVLFANAGIAETRHFAETDEAFFDRTFDINVKGLFFQVQALLPVLADGASVIVNASIVANKGLANMSVYNASKAAVRSFARTWANDLKARGIRVNAVSPGATRTPIMETGLKLDAEGIAGFDALLAAAAPAGRMGRPEEIAAGVLFLADARSSYVNGIELSVDGGFAQV